MVGEDLGVVLEHARNQSTSQVAERAVEVDSSDTDTEDSISTLGMESIPPRKRVRRDRPNNDDDMSRGSYSSLLSRMSRHCLRPALPLCSLQHLERFPICKKAPIVHLPQTMHSPKKPRAPKRHHKRKAAIVSC